MRALLFMVLLLSIPACQTQRSVDTSGWTQVDFESGHLMLVPPSYSVAYEGSDTVLVMPVLPDAVEESPIALRMTSLRSLDGQSDKYLQRLRDEGHEIRRINSNYYFEEQHRALMDDAGLSWSLIQGQIIAQDQLLTVTEGLVTGYEDSPEVDVIRRDFDAIVGSIQMR